MVQHIRVLLGHSEREYTPLCFCSKVQFHRNLVTENMALGAAKISTFLLKASDRLQTPKLQVITHLIIYC